MHKTRLEIDLKGNTNDRDSYLRSVTQIIYNLTDHKFTTLIREMVKNIYDHTPDKSGRVVLEVNNGNEISFEVVDHGTKSYDYETLKKQVSSKMGNGINRGLGLKMIQDIAAYLEIENFEINTDEGFKFSGVYIVYQDR